MKRLDVLEAVHIVHKYQRVNSMKHSQDKNGKGKKKHVEYVPYLCSGPFIPSPERRVRFTK